MTLKHERRHSELYYGYRIDIQYETVDAGRYHDRTTVTAEIYDLKTGELLHTLSNSERRGHLLKKKQPRSSMFDGVVSKAEKWIRENCEYAVELMEKERVELKKKSNELKRKRYEELGCNDLAFILLYDVKGEYYVKQTRDIARLFDLGSIREVNKLLVEWGLQRKVEDGYDLIDNAYGDHFGHFFQLYWNPKGWKTIWDKAVANGRINGSDEDFVRIIKEKTTLFDWMK